MDDYGLIVRMPKMDELSAEKAWQILHDHSGEIGQDVLDRIEGRTPELTGALKEDETYRLGSGNELLTWYTNSTYQIGEWGKTYAINMEGPPLGDGTNVASAGWPHQMFFKVTTEDIPLIARWAQDTVDQAAESMTQAAEAGASTWEM